MPKAGKKDGEILVRGIPFALRKLIKRVALDEDTSMSRIIIKVLKDYVEGYYGKK